MRLKTHSRVFSLFLAFPTTKAAFVGSAMEGEATQCAGLGALSWLCGRIQAHTHPPSEPRSITDKTVACKLEKTTVHFHKD